MIELTVNAEARLLPPGCTVAALVESEGCGRRGVAVAVNEEVVPRSSWETATLASGDRVEILRAAQGGC
jgi:sulfur carrier protein